MSRRIEEDNKEFRDVVAGKVDDQIKKFIKNGQLVGWRPKGGKFIINIPQIDLPTFRYGRNKKGWGRGPGDIGDVVGRDPQKGNKPGEPGDTPGETVPVGIDLETIIQFLQGELELPNLEPKDCSEVFKEEIIYNGIRKTGPESLRHTRRTMKNTMIRMIQTGEYDPEEPILIPIQEDKRYRSWNTKQIPESNAVIFYARDWSGSMDDKKCDIVINTAWWIDCWIRQFYKRTESVYIGHDTEAVEVDKEKFYKMRYGGGTMCSSAFELIKSNLEFRFPVNQWNIYIFYFSDGENWTSDNEKSIEIIKDLEGKANMIGIGEILHGDWGESFAKTLRSKMPQVDKDKIRLYELKATGDQPAAGQELQMIKHFLGKKS